jgi:hypothetical protein
MPDRHSPRRSCETAPPLHPDAADRMLPAGVVTWLTLAFLAVTALVLIFA